MSEEQTQLRTTSMKGGEIFVALVLIGFCILGWIETTNFDVEVSMTNTLGPAIFPQILLGGITAGSLFLIVQAMRDKLDRGNVKWGKLSKVFLAAGAMLFQALTFEELSTFVAAGITLPTLLWIANVKPKAILGVTIGFLLFVYVFFVLILRVPLPMQFLPTLLG
jgi:hypothetical protein